MVQPPLLRGSVGLEIMGTWPFQPLLIGRLRLIVAANLTLNTEPTR